MELPRRALVLGFRRTGQAVARVLAARGVRRARRRRAATPRALGVDPAAFAGVELRLGAETPALLDGVDLVVPSPGVPRGAPLLRGGGRAAASRCGRRSSWRSGCSTAR